MTWGICNLMFVIYDFRVCFCLLYTSPLQGSNRNYDTGIRTTNIRQVEFGSGEWQTVSGEFRIYLHSMSLIYRKILCIIRND